MTSRRFKLQGELPAVRSAFGLELVHETPEHARFPHVVKFSGGRSSAAMLLGLLKAKQLRPSRGDVVIFNNTSTESPATYRFVRLIQRITEERFKVPFFWTEFITYEDASRGEWRRHAGYRLAKPRPYTSKMLKGYRRRGEVFEELVSWKQQLPNRFTRICTDYLKLHTTALFLSDWFGREGGEEAGGLRRLGHWHERSRIDPARYKERHEIATYHLDQPVERDAQAFQEYTKAPLTKRVNPALRGRVFDRRAVLQGDDAVPFVSVVGLRADEPSRVGRVLERNTALSNEKRFAHGETVTAPLFDAGITKEDVRAFWKKQAFDLELPYDLNQSNCVFCFMKGKGELRRLARHVKPEQKSGKPGPDSLAWWRDLELRYARRVQSSEDPSRQTTFGFFGKNELVYSDLASDADDEESDQDDALPCECTD